MLLANMKTLIRKKGIERRTRSTDERDQILKVLPITMEKIMSKSMISHLERKETIIA
jgi:hypothetical protein